MTRRILCWAVIGSVGVLWLALRLMHPDMTGLRLGLTFLAVLGGNDARAGVCVTYAG